MLPRWRRTGAGDGIFAWRFPVADQEIQNGASHAAPSIVVPLLSLPQTTHYILDGFIWKRE